jgi:cysteine desulfurase
MLNEAREEIAALLGARTSHTFFTPSPAVAAERIIVGVSAARRKRIHGVITAAEPRRIADAARLASPEGVVVSAIDDTGRALVADFAQAVAGPEIGFAAVSTVNTETGTLHPVDDLYATALSLKVPLIVDASASIGRLRPPRNWDALLATPSAWGGPGGMGVLAMRPELRWVPAWADGAPWAPGSTSVPAAVAAAAALRKRLGTQEASTARVATITATLREAMRAIPHSVILGGDADTAPHTLAPHIVAAQFVYADAEAIARELDARGIAVHAGCGCGGLGAGGACPVLRAMGAMTHGVIRLGIHDGISADDAARIARELTSVVAEVRTKTGAPV